MIGKERERERQTERKTDRQSDKDRQRRVTETDTQKRRVKDVVLLYSHCTYGEIDEERKFFIWVYKYVLGV